MKEITIQELLAQRVELQVASQPTDGSPNVMTEEEAQALLATAVPGARNSFNLIATSDAFAPSGRRFIAPIIKRNGDPSTAQQIKKLSNTHMAIMDFMLSNPRASMLTVAKEFGITQAWLSTVKNSDLWRITYNERRALLEEHQKIILSDQLTAIASKGLACLEDAIDDEATTLASKITITKLALEHSGFSSTPSMSVVVNNNTQNNVVQVDESKQAAIAAARARVLAKATHQHAKLGAVTIDGQSS